MRSGVYKITNTVNGKYYIGSSYNCRHRWSEHKWELNSNRHNNSYLQNAWNKYGASAFTFEVIQEVPVEQLLDEEQKHITVCRSVSYNLAEDAASPMKGRKASDATKKKMSESHKGIVQDAEWVSKRAKALLDVSIYSFLHQNGDTFTGTRADFYTKHNLSKAHVCSLIKGNRPQHKGWTLCQ